MGFLILGKSWKIIIPKDTTTRANPIPTACECKPVTLTLIKIPTTEVIAVLLVVIQIAKTIGPQRSKTPKPGTTASKGDSIALRGLSNNPHGLAEKVS